MDARFLAWLVIACALPLRAGPGPRPRPASRQDTGDERVVREHGFRVVLPDESWSFREGKATGQARFVLELDPPGTPGRVQARVTVELAGTQADPAERRRLIVEYARGVEGIGEPELFEALALQAQWPGVRVEQDAPGAGRFLVEQVYLASGARLYTLQFHAPVAEFGAHRRVFDAVLASFAFLEPTPEERELEHLRALAGRCGSELDWAADWESAAERAGERGTLVLVYLRSYPGFALSDDHFAGHFSDPDLVALVDERLVPLRYSLGMDAPFEAQASYGMSATTFGNSLLLVDPQGEVRSELYASVPSAAVEEWLIGELSETAAPGEPAPLPAGGLAQGECFARRGELERALAVLAAEASPAAAILRASILRRQRRGEAALAELERVEGAGDAELRRRALAERARVWLGMGRVAQVEPLLLELAEGSDELADEACFLLGASCLAAADREAARGHWRRLALERPGSRWAPPAAAGLTSTLFDLGLRFRIGWPPEELFAALRMPAPDPLGIDGLERAERDALGYLLRAQRDDGSWICPSEIASGIEGPHVLTFAISAICAESLLGYRTEPAVATALERALGYVLGTWERLRASPPPETFMDYLVWCDGYVASFLAACLVAELGERARLERALGEVVDDAASRQKSCGGWSYYRTPDLARADEGLDIAMSFTTAAVLMGLGRAAEAGVEVPEPLLQEALACLEGMRDPDGLFEYMVDCSREGLSRAGGEGGAAGRGPACELALLRGGRGGIEGLRDAIERFARRRDGLAKERRKALMHCGPEGQGSHYVFFDYMTCAEAIAALPDGADGAEESARGGIWEGSEKSRYRVMLLEEILAARNADGSFLDNPIIGPAFAAGAALRAFHLLGARTTGK